MPILRSSVIALSMVLPILSAPAIASPVCVSVPEANLRQGPGTQFEKSWEVFKYMPFRQVGQQGDWLQVEDLDGDKHWIYRPLVSDGIKCAVVKSKEANVRNGPGTQHAKSALSPVERYYSFRITSQKGDWVQVEDEVFNAGWVHKSLLWMP
ncbi:MAG: SH3 domain-containing protein [Pseudomonadota bacterium]